ncbi:hypothetical protein DLM75_16550 [Leptospira stimsonii]|uniref:Uncharacterized protein n=1 Tax=Leptospira stimsonii TaxID=2202203 RepID=A0A396Z1T9_9LEPT|nr:hypothetical protein DLM75_16550 [Leptospira stimsonii]
MFVLRQKHRLTSASRFVRHSRSRSDSLRAKATLLCHFGSRDAPKGARTSFQPRRAQALADATSRSLCR